MRELPEPIPDGLRVLLETAFHQEEGAAISDCDDNGAPRSGDVLPVRRWLEKLGRRSIGEIYPHQLPGGLYIRINPMQSSGKSDSEVAVLRHTLVEFDYDASGGTIPKEVQYRTLVESGFPISVILDSGNRSIHGWIRLDAGDLEEYHRRRALVWQYFARWNLDPLNQNPSRYSRVPGAMRAQGRTELLAVNVGAGSWQEWEEKNQTKTEGTSTEKDEFPPVDWEKLETEDGRDKNKFVQAAIYPKDSILASFVTLARECTEAADCYLIGSIMPIAAAMLARNVSMNWSPTNLYPNLFTMLVGKPGDRKSTTINLARLVGQKTLSSNTFLSKSLSPETLFDEYDLATGGTPDKLWCVDDANPILADWKHTKNGERVASRFLELYDCCGLSENFRRNKTSKESSTLRVVPITSTSILFGATFNIACFQGQSIRAGLSRRFQYYVGDSLACTIEEPRRPDLDQILESFDRLKLLKSELRFSKDARTLWGGYQRQNRALMDQADPLAEAELGRLNSAPAQVLKIAMIFEAARCAQSREPLDSLRAESLSLAIDHVDECIRTAGFLDAFADRKAIQTDAEVLLAKIQKDFRSQKPHAIYAWRSKLTATYAPNPGRGGLSPDHLYLKLIPELVRQNLARLVKKVGKAELYAFRTT
jgi:hypothetical protein